METSPNTMSASIMKTPPCSRWRLGLATYRAKGHGEHKERGIALSVKRGTPATWMWNPREELILPDAITSAGLMGRHRGGTLSRTPRRGTAVADLDRPMAQEETQARFTHETRSRTKTVEKVGKCVLNQF
ncbi:hypothetical protein E4U26_000093 [Claviceps purpurea]|nr:hypothetical protein E4U26_000093 [Claviceps purpurea]